jgi:small-conductance mechanosensitive channel
MQTPSSLKSDLYFEIARQFSANGIEIPFPQRDVHVKSIPQLRRSAPSSHVNAAV